MPFDSILVPLDGTATAASALPYAEALASRTGARLMLMRAASAPRLAADVAAAQRDVLDSADAYLKATAAELEARGKHVDIALPYGPAATWIPEEAALRHADLVVMATHDRAGIDRWLHGSVSEQVAAHSPVPVLVVRATDDMRAVERLSMPDPFLVVPLDGSDFAEAALPIAADLARALHARLVLVSIVVPPAPVAAPGVFPFSAAMPLVTELEKDAWEYVRRTRAALPTWLIEDVVVRVGDPAIEIALVAEQRAAAAVVMATHGRTGIVRTILGSVAGGGVHHAATPVLLVHPRRPRAAEEPAIAYSASPAPA
jgi:nucleotide-binding universal stress UspA family protein